jgi:hypothetical protein
VHDHVRRRVVPTIQRLGAATVVAVAVAMPSGALGQPTPSPQPSLTGNMPPNFPSAPSGRVAVVSSSPPFQNMVAVAVRNGSSASVDRLKVSMTVRGPDGKVVGRGSTTTIVPSALNPNEIAVGSVRLERGVPAGAKYEFEVTSHRLRNKASSLAPTATALSAPMVGSVAQQLTGSVSNAGRRRAPGPVVVVALCVNQAGHPVLTGSSTVARRGLAAGASTPFTINFPALCPAYLVGARSR